MAEVTPKTITTYKAMDNLLQIITNTDNTVEEGKLYFGTLPRTQINKVGVESLPSRMTSRGAIQPLIFTSPGQRMVIAYPKAWGLLKSIRNANDELLPSFTLDGSPQILDILGIGIAEDFYVYYNEMDFRGDNYEVNITL